MKPTHRTFFLAASLLMTSVAIPLPAQQEIGFIEKFALAQDRDAALKELIPGTEEYYFYHALHYQNTGRHTELDGLLAQWAKRSPDSPLLLEIKNRGALLNYESNPRATLEYLKQALNVSFDHQQDTLHPKPNLPSALDPQLISPAAYLEIALRDPYTLDSSHVTDLGLEYLLTHNQTLSPQQRRVLLQRVDRPDTPHLLELILADLSTRESRGFGEFRIHGMLLLEQLKELRKANPGLMQNRAFVQDWLLRLHPGADTDVEHDAKAREAWLEALWDMVKDLSPTFNSLKAHILYQRLVLDQKLGVHDPQRFLEYLKLPRSMGYVSAQYREQNSELFRHPVNLNENFQAITERPPIANDEPLVRSYLTYFLKDEAGYDAYVPYVAVHYLQRVFAEAKLLAGSGSAESLLSLLPPAEVQALRERVEIDFDPANPETFAPDAPVKLDLLIKNVPHLTVNIYEINTENFHLSQGQQIGTDLDLDGLVANQRLVFDYPEAPILRVKRTFNLTNLPARRGVWIVDFIGNGRSSRALIRKGQLHVITRASSAGTALTVLDENRAPVAKAYALLGGQRYAADEHGEIIIPFSNNPGMQNVVLGDGDGFTQLENLLLQGENYALQAGFHVPRESLLSGKKAVLAFRPTLTMNGAPANLSLLEEAKLTIVSTTQDGVSSTLVKPDFKLAANKEATQEINVPERLASLQFTLEGRVTHLLTGEKTSLSTSETVQINQRDRSDATSDLFLSNIGPNFVLQELGRTGEPRVDRAVSLKLFRPEFTQPVEMELKTDANGMVQMGPLDGISSLQARTASGGERSWALPVDRASNPANIQIAAGRMVLLPWMEGEAKPEPPLVSLLEERRGIFVRSLANDKYLSVQGGYLFIKNLEPGDYDLRFGSTRQQITIRVAEGQETAGWIIGNARHLEARPALPLQIGGVSLGKDEVTVQLGNVTPGTRVHVLASRFLPSFDAFDALGQSPHLQPLVGTPGHLLSLFVSGRTLGEEYRYVMERRGAKKYPGVMLPRSGLLLNPWVLNTTETTTTEAQLGEQFRRAENGPAATMSAPAAETMPVALRVIAPAGTDIADVDFLASAGPTFWNLSPDREGKVTLKLADLGDRQFVRVLAINANSSVMRDLPLEDAKTKLRDLALRNGLDPNGHFTRQNQVTILEKDAPFTIKDAATAQFEVQGHLGSIFDLFRTLSKNDQLAEFSFVLDWPTLDEAKKRELYSLHACHELSFFLQHKDPEFFKSVILPYLANKRDKTFMDHYLLGEDLQAFLRPWSYQRLNIAERILLAQRHPGEAAATAREMREMNALLPPNVEQMIFFFDSALGGKDLAGTNGGALEAARGQIMLKAKDLADADKRAPTGDPFASPAGAVPAMPAAPPVIGRLFPSIQSANTFSGNRYGQKSMGSRSGNASVAAGSIDALAPGITIEPATAGRYYVDKMQRLIFSSVYFNGATIDQAIDFLRLKSKELDTTESDPTRKGVRIFLKQDAAPSTAQISLDLHDVPMVEALRYITELAGMKYKVEPYGVVVVPLTEIGNEQYVQEFKVSPDFLKKGGGGDARSVLAAAGIGFPEGASALFNAANSTLVVRNTQPNLDMVANFVGSAPVSAERELVERDAAARQQAVQEFYRKLGPTEEWAENNYYKLPIEQQTADLISINGFWKDYAAWDGKGGFLSAHVAEASRSFSEMMLALAVLDLPFPSQAKEPKVEVKDLSLTLTPTQRMILFHRELKPAEIDKNAPRLLVSQNFYRNGDRYLEKDGEKEDKFVTEEFLTGVVYGCQVVVTNPTSATQKLDLLLQIPQGAIPVLGSKPTDNRPLTLESYRTFTTDYFFYFPRAGKFAHHPVHVSKAEKIVAFAPPFTFSVVNELTKMDTNSWDYVSQFGKAEDVLAFLEQHNIHQLDLDRMAWRLRDEGFFKQAIALLTSHHVYHPTTWSYALVHNDADALREYLLHADGFLAECGPALESKLVTIDPVARFTYQHLEYSPLVNARAHQLGAQRTILNDHFHQQYERLLTVLAHLPKPGDEDRLAVSYYLFLQDRIEEALAMFGGVDATKIAEHLQYDYLKAVTALYQGDTATARQLALAHTKHPVDRWNDKFAEVLSELDEIEGKKPDKVKQDDREQKQNQLATAEPTLDFTVENKEVKLAYHNVKEITVNYYPMDLEFLFSTTPFVGQDATRFGMIHPNHTEHLQLPADQDSHTFALPREYHSSNVLVEILAGGKSTAHAYYANELNIQLSENYGRLQVLHAKDNRPLPQVYVKVFAEINGEPKFYKDGYTDLRGKFDYLSLSTGELDQATRFSVLILSDEFGAAVREVKPPRQ